MVKSKYINIFRMLAMVFLFAATQIGAEEEEENSGLIVIALPYYMPETRFGVGFTGLYFFNNSNSGTAQRPNEFSLYGAATANEQYSIGTDIKKFFNRDQYKTTGTASYSIFPDLFWGIGPQTQDSGEDSFTSEIILAEAGFSAKVWENIYLGPYYGFMSDHLKHAEGKLESKAIPGSEGTRISGIGGYLSIDYTDSSFFPRKGVYIEVINLYYLQAAGSSHEFSELIVDARYYYNIHEEHVLAFQSFTHLTGGNTPFQAMPKLGGDVIMRGYYEGRYRDKVYSATQVEYRFPVYWRLGGVLFAGGGSVAEDYRQLMGEKLKISYGTGLRATVQRDEHINIRLDAGFNDQGTSSVYVLVKEAF